MATHHTLVLLLLIFSSCTSSATNQVAGNNSASMSNTIPREAAGRVGEANITVGNVIGLVVLKEGFNRNDFVRIYNEDGSLWYQFTYYYDDSDGEFEYFNESFRPFAFHPDHFLLALKCVKKENGRYEVIVNEETGLRKYIREDDPVLKFETWEEHVLGVFAISFNRQENLLLNEPEGQTKSVSFTDEMVFQPVEIRGDWLKIRWNADGHTGSEARVEYDYGWIRWKEGRRRLLIELFYFS